MSLRGATSPRSLGAALSFGLLLAICGCRKAAEEAPAPTVLVKAQHPQLAPISEEIAADAILAPLSQAALAPKISAPIRKLYVERGARVHAGQLLVSLEARDLAGSAIDSRGSLVAAQAGYDTAVRATIPEEDQKAKLDVDQAKANLAVADRTARERKRLLGEGAIAGRDADTAIAAAVQAQATYDLAVQHLASVRNVTREAGTQTAQGQLTSARGRYQAAEAQASYADLRSPINGVVSDRPLFAGETATAGAPIITVMDTSSLLAKLHLAQAAAQKLRRGATARLQIAGMDDPLEATVSFISPVLDPGSTTVEVWLSLPNRDGSLKVGTPVHAVITGNTVAQALQIPTRALLPTSDARDSVMVAGADGAAHKRVVRVGIRTADSVQILSGLSAEDNVITEGSYGLDDGTRITLEAGDRGAGSERPDGGRDAGNDAGDGH